MNRALQLLRAYCIWNKVNFTCFNDDEILEGYVIDYYQTVCRIYLDEYERRR
jgi:hypothetical protein